MESELGTRTQALQNEMRVSQVTPEPATPNAHSGLLVARLVTHSRHRALGPSEPAQVFRDLQPQALLTAGLGFPYKLATSAWFQATYSSAFLNYKKNIIFAEASEMEAWWQNAPPPRAPASSHGNVGSAKTLQGTPWAPTLLLRK